MATNIKSIRKTGSDADGSPKPTFPANYTMTAKGLANTGLMSLHTRLARRIDPFRGDTPALQAPADQALHAWSEEYVARSFASPLPEDLRRVLRILMEKADARLHQIHRES